MVAVFLCLLWGLVAMLVFSAGLVMFCLVDQVIPSLFLPVIVVVKVNTMFLMVNTVDSFVLVPLL